MGCWKYFREFEKKDFGGAVENRTPVRNHATPNLYMLREVV